MVGSSASAARSGWGSSARPWPVAAAVESPVQPVFDAAGGGGGVPVRPPAGGAGAGAGAGTGGAAGAVATGVDGCSPAAGLRPGDEGEILGQRRRNPRHLFLARGAGHADTGAVQRFFAIRSGARISFSSSFTNRLWSLPLSERRTRARPNTSPAFRWAQSPERGPRKSYGTGARTGCAGGIDARF